MIITVGAIEPARGVYRDRITGRAVEVLSYTGRGRCVRVRSETGTEFWWVESFFHRFVHEDIYKRTVS